MNEDYDINNFRSWIKYAFSADMGGSGGSCAKCDTSHTSYASGGYVAGAGGSGSNAAFSSGCPSGGSGGSGWIWTEFQANHSALRAHASEWLTLFLAKWGPLRGRTVAKAYVKSGDARLDLRQLCRDLGFYRQDGLWALPSDHPLYAE